MFRVVSGAGRSTFSQLSRWVCARHLTSQQYDIVIVGGGLIGNAAAVALGLEECLENKRILVLDQSTATSAYKQNSPFNIRVINLTVGNADFLTDIGVWDKVRDMRYHAYNNIYCWEAHSNHTISFTEDPMGFIVENNVLELGLLEVSKNLHNVEVRRGVKVKDIKLPEHEPKLHSVELNLDSGDVITADLLIGADGANSSVRRKMDIPVLSWNYDQQGIVCTMKSNSCDYDDVAYQRFLNTGPIALLPLGDALFSLVWSCKNSLAQDLMSLSDEQFVDRVNNALQKDARVPSLVAAMENIAERLDVLEKPPQTPIIKELEGSRAKFPLGFSQSSRYVGTRTVLLGDAAHRIHPLAGQGANIGFRGVQYLCKEIARNPDKDLGDNDVLVSWETKLQRHITPMMGFVDGMNKLYTTSADPIVAFRSLGTGFINKTGALKNMFMRNARE